MSALLAFLLALPAFAGKAIPPSPESYVYNEGIISEGARQALSRSLSRFERETGHQFVVALFQSLEGEELEGYCNRLFKAWRIGRKGFDDGLLFAVFRDDRRWRVEVGYGLEPVLTDLQAADIVETHALARFKLGDLEGGVLIAQAALQRSLLPKAAGAGLPSASTRPARKDGVIKLEWHSDRTLQFGAAGAALWLLLFLVGLALLLVTLAPFFLFFWATYEAGFDWGGKDIVLSSRQEVEQARYPHRLFLILVMFGVLLVRILMVFGRVRLGSSHLSGGYGGHGGGGGFLGGGGSSGGGGASGSW